MPTRCRRGRGFTLIEVLIGAAIFLMMMTAIYESLLLAIRLYDKVRDAAETQEEALRVLNDVERALENAATVSIRINPDPAAKLSKRFIVFASAQSDRRFFATDPANGRPMWQRFVCFYVATESDGRLALMRKERRFTPTSTLPTSIPTRNQMVDDTTLPAQMLTDNLSDVSFGNQTSIDFRLVILTERKNGLTLSTRITPGL